MKDTTNARQIALTDFERGLIVNALREVARKPTALAEINEHRHRLIERLHIEG